MSASPAADHAAAPEVGPATTTTTAAAAAAAAAAARTGAAGEAKAVPGTTLKWAEDQYGGALVDGGSLPLDAAQFAAEFAAALEYWQKEKRRGVWLQVPRSHSQLVPVATEMGFDFHHAQPGYVMLTRWLPADEASTLPNYCGHFVGVGGFVINERREVLVIQERSGPAVGRWKIPGGLADVGEEVSQTAMREVLEETGVRTEFAGLVCFRQSHSHAFGRSDFYFVCRLRPLTSEIKMQEAEIADARWMPVDEFLALPHFKEGIYRRMMELGRDHADGTYAGISEESLPVFFRPGHNHLYSATAAGGAGGGGGGSGGGGGAAAATSRL